LKSTTLPSRLRAILILGRTDPVIFANFLLGMPLHPGQVKFLRDTTAHLRDPNVEMNKINILVPSNRWAKSTTEAIKHIWKHFYKVGIPGGNSQDWLKADYRTANIAPHSSLVEPVFNYIDQIMSSRYMIRNPTTGKTTTNKCQIEWFYLKDRNQASPPMRQFFAYNSYIEHRTIGATAADSLEGKPWGYISYDEGGRSDHLEDEVNGTLLARLFDWSGELDIPSTPDMTSASILYHYKLYQDGLLGLNSTYTMEGSLRDNIFFTPEQIEKQYKLFENNPLRDQVLEGKFVFAGDNIFPANEILDAQDATLDDGIRYIEGHTYVVGTDTAIGRDEMVFTVLDTTEKPYTLVREIACKGNSKSPQMHLNDFIDLVLSYSDPNKSNIKHMLETWNGESVRFYHDLPYWLQAITKCYGSWQPESRKTDNQNKSKNGTSEVKKADLLLSLKKLLAGRELKLPKNNPKLIQQLSIYREDDRKIPTDRVMSLALATWIAVEGAAFLSNNLSFIDL
jgi:hypothetical protein